MSSSLELSASAADDGRDRGQTESPPPPPPSAESQASPSAGAIASTPLLQSAPPSFSSRGTFGSTSERQLHPLRTATPQPPIDDAHSPSHPASSSEADARWQAKLDATIAKLQRVHAEEMASKARELHALQRQLQSMQATVNGQATDNSRATTATNETAGFESASPPSLAQSPSGSALSSPELLELSRKFFPELDSLLNPPAPLPSAQIMTAASVFLYDSFHCRSIAHSTTLAALQAYQFIHVSRWKLFVRWIGWMHLLLGFIEPPSSIMTDGVRHGPTHLVCGLIELCFLFVYAFHAYKQYIAYGPGSKGYWRSPWRTIKVFVLAACFIDVVISTARNTDTPGIHLSQILRVFFVLEQSSRMRQLCSCMIRSLPAIISIMFLCFLHIAVFALIGYMFIRPLEKPSSIYPDDSRLYFTTLGSSFQSIMILLTSANFPSVMLPSYRQHWFVCIFFVCFIMIGLYCLLQLTTAVVFHSFQMHTKDKLARALGHRDRALQACFTLLSSYCPGEGTIDLNTWVAFIATIRPKWKQNQAEILFRAATLPDDGISRLDLADPVSPACLLFSDTLAVHPSAAAVAVSCSSKMDFIDFEQIVRFTQKSFEFTTTPQRHAAPAKAVAAAAEGEVNIDISMQSVNSKGGRPSAASLAYPDPAVQANPLAASLHRPVVAPSVLGSSDGPTVVATWGGVVPAFVLDSPAMASLAKVLIWFFSYRMRIPRWFRIQVLGRSEANIGEREEEEGPIDTTAAGPTPLEPVLSVRTQLTTFSLSELLVDCLTLFHGFLLILRMALNSLDAAVRPDALEALDVMVILIQVIFVLEMTVKLWLCRARFFNSRLNKLDALTILVIWVAQIVISSHNFGGAEDAVSCIRLARLFRLHHRLNSFTLLLQVLSQVGPALVALLGVMFILLYTYSMIGMMWFCNELQLGKLADSLAYDQEDFYVLNFNDLAHSLIALFYQLVVNDWFILMEAVVFRVGDSARIFFVSFYAVSVLIVFSVCTAFVVEAYMDMHEAKVQASLKGKAASVSTQLASLSMPLPVSLATGAANVASVDNLTQRHGKGGGGGDGGFSMGGDKSDAGAVTSDSAGLPRSSSGSFAASSKSFRQVAQAVRQKSHGPLQPRIRPQSIVARASSSAIGSNPQQPQSLSLRPELTLSPAARFASTRAASGSSASLEALLLSRIRDRASSVGLSVRLQPHRGMLHTLSRVFGAEEDEEAEGADEGAAIAEEDEDGQSDEKADE